MSSKKSAWEVLSEIRRQVDRQPSNERCTRENAYFAWKRRGEGDGHDKSDWYEAQRRFGANEDFWRLDNAIENALADQDYERQLALAVVKNAAVVLDMRPTDVKADTLLSQLNDRKLELIVAAVSGTLCRRFNSNYWFASDVRRLIGTLWHNEFRVI